MIDELIFTISLIFVNIFLFKIFIKLFNKLKIYDEPDFSRKIHTSNVPLVGGVIFLLNIFLYLLTNIVIDATAYFNSIRELLAFLTGSLLIFLVGLYDDKYILKPNTKLILISIIIMTTLSIDNSFEIKFINVLFNEKVILLKTFGTVFTQK